MRFPTHFDAGGKDPTGIVNALEGGPIVEVRVRTTVDDADAITGLVTAIWEGDDLWLPGRADSYDLAGGSTVLLAEIAGELAGVASYSPSRRAALGVIQLDVAFEHRRRGVGSALLSELRKLHPNARMMVRVRPWDRQARSFYGNAGFRIVERVIEGWLDPASAAMADWLDRQIASRPASLTVESFGPDDAVAGEAAAILSAWFARHHPWLPSAARTPSEARLQFIDPALPGTMHLARDDGRAVGAGLLVPDPFGLRPHDAHLAYLGVAEEGRPDEVSIVGALVSACLRSAAQQERDVQVEVSDQHGAGWEVIATVPAAGLREGLLVLLA